MVAGKVATSSQPKQSRVEEGDFFFVYKGSGEDVGVGQKIDEHRKGLQAFVEVKKDGQFSEISESQFTNFVVDLAQKPENIENYVVRLDFIMEFVCNASVQNDLYSTNIEFEVYQQDNGDYWAVGIENENVWTVYSKGNWDNRKFVYKKSLSNALTAADYKLKKKREKEKKGYTLQPAFRGFNPRTSQFF